MKNLNRTVEEWERSSVNIFWGEIAPCDHVLQIYENDETFITTLTNFACHGFEVSEGVVIIATPKHITALNERIKANEYDVELLKSSCRYFPLDAALTLSKFMVDGWPDENLFNCYIRTLISEVGQYNRKIRAFGEMVALLWAEGKNGATVQLERLWCRLHENEMFSLYCAYPKSGFTQSPKHSVESICKKHTLLIDGQFRSAPDIYYRNA